MLRGLKPGLHIKSFVGRNLDYTQKVEKPELIQLYKPFELCLKSRNLDYIVKVVDVETSAMLKGTKPKLI